MKRLRKLRELAHDLRQLRPELEQARGEIAALDVVTRDLREALASATADQTERDRRLLDAVQVVADQEADNRRRLRALRAGESYERAFSEPEPLVSVTISTHTGYERLVERALPSVLNQTYQNLEVVIVGDCAPPEAAEAIAKLDDPRIRYSNLPRRGPYPSEQRALWLVGGTYPANEARWQSRGSWIAPLDDDDAFRPDHIELLLNAARETRSEVAYGLMLRHTKDGESTELGVFPPKLARFGWQAAIMHEGLRFVEGEVSAELFGWPGDWSRCRRMLRAGVRFTMISQQVTDYYPSRLWKPEAAS